jgi:hypothetical protein
MEIKLKNLLKSRWFWITVLAVMAILAMIILTDWEGFRSGFDKGFNSLE